MNTNDLGTSLNKCSEMEEHSMISFQRTPETYRTREYVTPSEAHDADWMNFCLEVIYVHQDLCTLDAVEDYSRV